MRNRIWLPVFLCVFLIGTVPGVAQHSLDAMIDRDIASLVATYKELHAAPELSHHEEKTSAFFAGQLRALGYTVTERIGKYEKPEWTGYGVVAVMKNGAGPTLLIRTELDALPVDEKTGLDSQLAGLGDEIKYARALDDWTSSEIVWLDELYDLTKDPYEMTNLIGDPRAPRTEMQTRLARLKDT